MPFRFKRKESVSEAIARTATELINKSVVELRGGKELESIHTVRKNIKKIRALLRLARGSLGRKTYRTLTDSLREAAEQLAATRDAHVKLQALEAVESHYHRQLGPRSFAHLKKALRQDCFASVREFDNRKSGGAVKRILKGTSREFQ